MELAKKNIFLMFDGKCTKLAYDIFEEVYNIYFQSDISYKAHIFGLFTWVQEFFEV
jgi:hypothetical protein